MKKAVRINADLEEGTITVSLSDEQKSRIPTPGSSIYVIQPYPVDDDEDDVDGIPTRNTIKEAPILAYSYDSVFVKASVLNDDMDVVTVNGDYKIPLVKNTSEYAERKMIVLSNEDEAKSKWRTLMNTSLKEAIRRREIAVKIENYLQTALEEEHH